MLGGNPQSLTMAIPTQADLLQMPPLQSLRQQARLWLVTRGL